MSNPGKKSVDRKTLYEEVWSEPVSVVALRYGLSDVGLAKICRSLAIPLPSRGYWAKVKAGRIMKRAPLPKLDDTGGEIQRLVKLPVEEAQARVEAKKELSKIRKDSSVSSIPTDSVPLHPLVQAAAKRLHRDAGWPKDTNLRHAPNEVLNIAVTAASLERALQITDHLIKALEKQAFTVQVDAQKSVTVLRREETGTELTFSLAEKINRSAHEVTAAEEQARKRYYERFRRGTPADYPKIPQYDYHATGILAIEVGRWTSRTWRDTPKTVLEKRLGEVTAGILGLARETHAKAVEVARQEEERRLAKERYEYLLKRRESEATRFQSLEAQATNWERAERVRRFADVVEQRRLSEGMLTENVREWLAWARAKADWLDPLVLVSDQILDAPEPKKPGYFW